MLSAILPSLLIGFISLLLIILNTLFWVPLVLIIAIIKLLLPIKMVTVICNLVLNAFASFWVSGNTFIVKLSKPIKWQVTMPNTLSTNEWYLVIANHQSWVDIIVLQQIFNGKIPFLKFFLKQQLFWVPLLGLAWWALDFPFMKRFTKSYLKTNPEKKGQDFKTTQKACEKFKSTPISVMNFAEGTRATKEKLVRQSSPYQHLLRPKAGGIGYVLTLMGNEINKVVNVTISYPNSGKLGIWQLITGKIHHIKVNVELIEIPGNIKGNYIEDEQIRKNTQQWLNQLWQEKDQLLSADMNANH